MFIILCFSPKKKCDRRDKRWNFRTERKKLADLKKRTGSRRKRMRGLLIRFHPLRRRQHRQLRDSDAVQWNFIYFVGDCELLCMLTHLNIENTFWIFMGEVDSCPCMLLEFLGEKPWNICEEQNSGQCWISVLAVPDCRRHEVRPQMKPDVFEHPLWSNGMIKIGDFGIVRLMTNEEQSSIRRQRWHAEVHGARNHQRWRILQWESWFLLVWRCCVLRAEQQRNLEHQDWRHLQRQKDRNARKFLSPCKATGQRMSEHWSERQSELQWDRFSYGKERVQNASSGTGASGRNQEQIQSTQGKDPTIQVKRLKKKQNI